MNLKEFIKEAKLVHGNKYSYTKVNLDNTKVVITCKKHGDFEQHLTNHIRGSGCHTCAKEYNTERKHLTHEEFIKRCNQVHSNKYTYPETYTDSRVKITITCPDHGDFEQLSGKHLHGAKCPECAKSIRQSTNFKEFLIKAHQVHGNKYIYDQNYIGSQNKLLITCPKHGDFEQTPVNHASGQGCPECQTSEKIEETRDTLLNISKIVHNNKYSYANLDYTNHKSPVTITCLAHGDFRTTLKSHSKGKGCPECSNIIKEAKNLKLFIKRSKIVHNNKYSYRKSRVIDKTSKIIIIITCPDHGDFEQTFGSHVSGSGCPNCSGEHMSVIKRLTHEEFINRANKVHNNKYTYPELYTDSRVKITITCPDHGDFKQTPSSHLSGHRCSVCSGIHTPHSYIEEVQKVHKNKYSYKDAVLTDGSKHVNFRHLITITCPDHGNFEISTRKHMSGEGCPICLDEETIKNYICRAREIYGNSYDYSKITTTKPREKKIIVCKDHGPFKKYLHYLVYRNSGCPSCANYGFDNNKPAHFYILEVTSLEDSILSGVDFLGYGITNNLKSRMATYSRELKKQGYKIKKKHLYKYEVGQDALDFEAFIKKSHFTHVRIPIDGLKTESINIKHKKSFLKFVDSYMD